jgi:hypothetical protein
MKNSWSITSNGPLPLFQILENHFAYSALSVEVGINIANNCTRHLLRENGFGRQIARMVCQVSGLLPLTRRAAEPH